MMTFQNVLIVLLFLQKSPIIGGYFAKRDPHVKQDFSGRNRMADAEDALLL